MPKHIIITLISSFFLLFPLYSVFANTCDITVASGQSIQSALDRASTDQTVCISLGSYEERITISKPVNLVGTRDNSGNTPVISDRRSFEWTDRQYNAVVTVENTNMVSIANLEIGPSPGRGIILVGTSNSSIENIRVSDIFQGGILLLNGSSNNTVNNCEIKDSVLAASADYYVSGKYWEPALSAIHESNNNRFSNCEVYRTYGEPVSAINSSGNIFENNYVHSNKNMGLYADNAPSTVFRNNLIVNNGSGIHITDEAEYGSIAKGESRVVENNIVAGGTIGLAAWGCDLKDPWQDIGIQPETCLFKDDVVKNNTFVDTKSNQYGENGIVVSDKYYTFNNSLILNNIVYSSDNNVISAPAVAGLFVSDNLWSSAPPNSFYTGSSYVVSNPGEVFINPLATDSSSYNLSNLDTALFCVKQRYADYGADCTTVGVVGKNINHQTNPLPTTPSSTISSPSPSVDYAPEFDVNKDGKINIIDLLDLVTFIFM